jgi:serine phosphatase RsbU (regulator of sigma subunit)
VQFRLFPQKQPQLRTLDYAGGCIQARRVGGDYYDFVNLGPGRVGLVVADISGKGMAGALLMANLQANLRSQYMVAASDLPRLLKSVNQLFYENTDENQYATLFFADYSDETRQLRYANCGHLPPYLFHADGTIEPLLPTAMVLGLFEDWSTATCVRDLKPGDTLVIYTDGVTDAMNAREEEFGSDRLIMTVRAHRELTSTELVKEIHAAVQQFGQGAQTDDVTVVIARAR